MPRKKPTVSRRNFLRQSAVAAGAASFPLFFTRSARANGVWGDFKSDVLSSGPFKVLEIHCYGAPSIWETLWVTKKTNGDPDYRDFDDEMDDAQFLCTTPGQSSPPNSDSLSSMFGTDQLDNEVFLGPAAQPIWDLADRTRLVGFRTQVGCRSHRHLLPGVRRVRRRHGR